MFCSLGPTTCYLVSAHRFYSISFNQSPPKFQVKICTMVICCSCRNFNRERHNPIGGKRFQILHSLMNSYFISARHSKFSSCKVSVRSLVYFWTVKVVAELIQIGSRLAEVFFSPLDEILEAKAMPPCLLIQQLSILLLSLAFLAPQPLDEHNYVNIPYRSNRNLSIWGSALY